MTKSCRCLKNLGCTIYIAGCLQGVESMLGLHYPYGWGGNCLEASQRWVWSTAEGGSLFQTDMALGKNANL